MSCTQYSTQATHTNPLSATSVSTLDHSGSASDEMMGNGGVNKKNKLEVRFYA